MTSPPFQGSENCFLGSGEKYYLMRICIYTYISSTDIHTVHKETLIFHEGSMELGKTYLKRLHSGLIMKKYETHWSSGTRDGYKPNSY